MHHPACSRAFDIEAIHLLPLNRIDAGPGLRCAPVAGASSWTAVLLALTTAIAGCGSSPSDANRGGVLSNGPGVALDRRCDLASFPSLEWSQCEAENFTKISEAAAEQASSPSFLARWQEQSLFNLASWTARASADPSWLAIGSGNTLLTPLCAAWSEPCVGDPFRHPEAAGADGATFYEQEAEVTPVVFYDSGCARLSGRVWRPRNLAAGAKLPSVIISNGSVQAPETLYWWAAQLLVRHGYVVMSFDPRGQGRSDMQTPDGRQGGNLDVSVFWTGMVDAIDFFRSTPDRPYPGNLACAGTYPTQVTPHNPYFPTIDRDRLGIAGHSAGAQGVSVVQGYGAPGADPWPGKLDTDNPVKAIVAWDGLVAPNGVGFGGATGNLPLPSNAGATLPRFGIRVPAMDQASEYGLAPIPFTQPPDRQAHKAAFDQWQAADSPAFAITIGGSSHYEWSLLPGFPATSWCPKLKDGACIGGWGLPLAQHYSLAWFDRWLKKPGEPGYEDADARLLNDDGPEGRNKLSWHFVSARDFPTRDGFTARCDNIRQGCDSP